MQINDPKVNPCLKVIRVRGKGEGCLIISWAGRWEGGGREGEESWGVHGSQQRMTFQLQSVLYSETPGPASLNCDRYPLMSLVRRVRCDSSMQLVPNWPLLGGLSLSDLMSLCRNSKRLTSVWTGITSTEMLARSSLRLTKIARKEW